MIYWDKRAEYDARGIDYDLAACLENNPQPGFDISAVERVLAVWEGEHDGDNWRWIIRLCDGRFAHLVGGCDYTGWDCQSWASSTIAATLDAVMDLAAKDERPEVIRRLREQIDGVKADTTHQEIGRDLGMLPSKAEK